MVCSILGRTLAVDLAVPKDIHVKLSQHGDRTDEDARVEGGNGGEGENFVIDRIGAVDKWNQEQPINKRRRLSM